jgi:hypothetical protein
MQSNGENLNARFENQGVKITASQALLHSRKPERSTHRMIQSNNKNVKTRTLQKPKSAAPEKDKCGRVRHPPI